MSRLGIPSVMRTEYADMMNDDGTHCSEING